MLEASGFDFRCRHPQKLLVKLAKRSGVNSRTVGKTAYEISIDVYRTFIPLKQGSSTMALACLDLALRIHHQKPEDVFSDNGLDYGRWGSSREEVMGRKNRSIFYHPIMNIGHKETNQPHNFREPSRST